ncbi:MAG: FecR family protein [Steroidobacteraceae bacterium]
MLPNPNRQLEYLHAQQASEWVQVLQNPSPEQRAAFVVWLKESPRNVREFLLMLTVEQALDRLDTRRLHDIETLLAQVDRQVVRLPGSPGAAEQRSQRMRPRHWLGLAASLILLLTSGWYWRIHDAQDWQEFHTGTSEQRAFELEDGSVIHLNTHSRVALHFSKYSRDVRLLEGEALFKVHHDVTRPFRVHTRDAVIQAVGTQFNVYNRAGGTVVAVIEGHVNVTPDALLAVSADDTEASVKAGASPTVASRLLSANEEAQVDAGQVTVRTMNNVLDAVAWQQRRLVFREQTLANIAEEFNRYSHRQIRLEGQAVKNRVYTGVFDADDPDSLALVLARDTDLAVEKTDQLIVVRTR